MPIDNKIKGKLQGAANKFIFFFAIEEFKPKIIQGLKTALKEYTPEKFSKMVDRMEFFDIPLKNMGDLVGWEKQAGWIKVNQLAEIFAAARPDLAEALIKKGPKGGLWLVNQHKHLLETVNNASKIVSHDASQEVMINIKCESCGQSFPYLKKDIQNLKECPFCHCAANESQDAKPADQTNKNQLAQNSPDAPPQNSADST